MLSNCFRTLPSLLDLFDYFVGTDNPNITPVMHDQLASLLRATDEDKLLDASIRNYFKIYGKDRVY